MKIEQKYGGVKVIKTFCDVCKKPTNRNMVTEPLVVDFGYFRIEIIVTTDRTILKDPAMCPSCLIEHIVNYDKKPRKPRKDKGIPKLKIENLKIIDHLETGDDLTVPQNGTLGSPENQPKDTSQLGEYASSAGEKILKAIKKHGRKANLVEVDNEVTCELCQQLDNKWRKDGKCHYKKIEHISEEVEECQNSNTKKGIQQ